MHALFFIVSHKQQFEGKRALLKSVFNPKRSGEKPRDIYLTIKKVGGWFLELMEAFGDSIGITEKDLIEKSLVGTHGGDQKNHLVI